MAADFMIQIRIAENSLRKEVRDKVKSIMISSRWVNNLTLEETAKKFLLNSKQDGFYAKLESQRNKTKEEVMEMSGLDETTVNSLMARTVQIIGEETRDAWLKTGPKPQWFGGTHGKS